MKSLTDKTLLVVDDHPIVLEGLSHVLTAEGYRVIKATSTDQAVMLVRHACNIDLLLIDLSISEGADGLAMLSSLRNEGFRQPAVIYTMHEELWNISQLIDSDAEGIVLKGEGIDELLKAVEVVAGGGTYRSPVFIERYNAVRQTRGILSSKDIEVLRRISKGESIREIASAMFLGEKAIEYHRSNILKKLGSKNMTEAISRAMRLGIITCMTAVLTVGASAEVNRPVPVDLGLSVQWADRNLGAYSPLSAGGYYAFGETEEKEYYDWSTYEHCVDGSWANHTDIGDESICGTSYDAAYVALGDGWRLPTYEEAAELLESCEVVTVEADPYNYLRFQTAEGPYIDFPLVGYKSGSKVVHTNTEGSIWTGTFYVEAGEEEDFVYYLNTPFFLALSVQIDPFINEASVQLGIQIRPVYTGTVGVDTVIVPALELLGVYSVDGRYAGDNTDGLAGGIYILRYSDGRSERVLVP